MKSPKLICLGSCRQTGKDTFCQLLKELNPHISRISLADQLKEFVAPISKRFFNKHPNELNLVNKELLRPSLIEIGRLARTLDIDFWCKEAYEKMYDIESWHPDVIHCCTDLRYPNEYQYFKKIYGDSMLLINIDRIGAPEPTDEEKANGPRVKELADVLVEWETDASLDGPRKTVRYFYDKYFLGYDQ
jgi:hypothetical protein